jgi:hypothetical protein
MVVHDSFDGPRSLSKPAIPDFVRKRTMSDITINDVTPKGQELKAKESILINKDRGCNGVTHSGALPFLLGMFQLRSPRTRLAITVNDPAGAGN